MGNNRRATFQKTIVETGEKPRTVYSIHWEKIHWIMGSLAALVAIMLFAITVRATIANDIRDVARQEFRAQLEQFHAQAQPAIRTLIDERIDAAHAVHAVEAERARRNDATTHAAELRLIAETLARLDERLASIEKRLDRER